LQLVHQARARLYHSVPVPTTAVADSRCYGQFGENGRYNRMAYDKIVELGERIV
jgi:hypothetical protein